MKLLKLYLQSHIKLIIISFAFCVIFAFVFFLYNIPLKAILYPALLCGLIGVIAIILDYTRVLKRHKQFIKFDGNGEDIVSFLPKAKSVEEADLQSIIYKMQEKITSIQSVQSDRYNEMIDYYTMWAHQIKTPIAAMCLNLQNEDSQLSRSLSSDLFRIEQYADMVMAFLRLGSESTDYVFREYNLDDIIKKAVRKFASEFILRKILLIYEPVNTRIVTDEKWFCFVLEQLISNALKYTESGSIKIYMCEPYALCIEDTGMGIAPNDLPRIFEKGYTGANGRKDGKASGIGLYLCKKICAKLNIRISAESVIDCGTAIYLKIDPYKPQAE